MRALESLGFSEEAFDELESRASSTSWAEMDEGSREPCLWVFLSLTGLLLSQG